MDNCSAVFIMCILLCHVVNSENKNTGSESLADTLLFLLDSVLFEFGMKYTYDQGVIVGSLQAGSCAHGYIKIGKSCIKENSTDDDFL